MAGNWLADTSTTEQFCSTVPSHVTALQFQQPWTRGHAVWNS